MPGSAERFPLPRNLVAAAESEGRQAWLETLPATVRRLGEQWGLVVGEPFQPGGCTAWVAAAVDADGREVVLKVGWRHSEALHEAAGLRTWAGEGAVRLRRRGVR